MLLVDSTLSLLCGLHIKPLLNIINAYAWDSHMDEDSRRQFSKVMDRLIYIKIELYGGLTPTFFHAAVLCLEKTYPIIFVQPSAWHLPAQQFFFDRFLWNYFGLVRTGTGDVSKDGKIRLVYYPERLSINDYPKEQRVIMLLPLHAIRNDLPKHFRQFRLCT